MKIYNKIFLLFATSTLALSAPQLASASAAQAGNVGNIIPENWGIVIFSQQGTRSTPPSCQGANVPMAWAIDVTTPGGQAILSVLLTAYATNKKVVVIGTNTCPSGQTNNEQVGYMATVDF